MIRYLRGKLIDRGFGELIVDVNGVGYRVFVPGSLGTGSRASGTVDEVCLYVHTHVREDAIQLYGFSTREELSMFETLLGVSGVGPKLALTVVSYLAPEALARAILAGEERALTKIPGVGKKTAARMLLELKDKLKETMQGAGAHGSRTGAGIALQDGAGSAVEDAVAALTALGFPEGIATDAVLQAAGDGAALGLEDLIKAALKRLDRAG